MTPTWVGRDLWNSLVQPLTLAGFTSSNAWGYHQLTSCWKCPWTDSIHYRNLSPVSCWKKIFLFITELLELEETLKAIWSDSPATERDIYSSMRFSEPSPSMGHASHLWAALLLRFPLLQPVFFASCLFSVHLLGSLVSSSLQPPIR